MVKSLASTLYSQSEYNYIHHHETARISELLARVMGLSEPQVQQIKVAGLLHDVGTLSLPSSLLNKQGAFTSEERQMVNQHATLGADLLRPARAMKDICEILENHHERWDGTGYPRGLKGEQIPLPARILSIVDSYHAMISDRPYRAAMTPEEAVQTLKKGAGLQWDPFLVDIFITVLNNLKQNEDSVTAT
jgi:putative nucleotidyltransferase with HDIG domain